MKEGEPAVFRHFSGRKVGISTGNGRDFFRDVRPCPPPRRRLFFCPAGRLGGCGPAGGFLPGGGRLGGCGLSPAPPGAGGCPLGGNGEAGPIWACLYFSIQSVPRHPGRCIRGSFILPPLNGTSARANFTRRRPIDTYNTNLIIEFHYSIPLCYSFFVAIHDS